LKSESEGVSRQLRGWADSLQNSPIKGQRYLDDSAREAVELKKQSNAFLKTIERYKAGGVRDPV
jgi:hypothetical protein